MGGRGVKNEAKKDVEINITCYKSSLLLRNIGPLVPKRRDVFLFLKIERLKKCISISISLDIDIRIITMCV